MSAKWWLIIAAGVLGLGGGSAFAAVAESGAGLGPPSDHSSSLAGTDTGVDIYAMGDAYAWQSRASVDGDGDPLNTYNDPAWQAHTSSGANGVLDPYIVLTPGAHRITGASVGDAAVCVNLDTGAFCGGLYGDNGGAGNHLGEMSSAMAAALGLNPNARNGGDGSARYVYVVFPGYRSSWPSPSYRADAEALFAQWGGVARVREVFA